MLDEKTLETCICIAKGCLDYNGGYVRDKNELNIYHHGIKTVIQCLEKLLNDNALETNTQIIALYRIGKGDE